MLDQYFLSFFLINQKIRPMSLFPSLKPRISVNFDGISKDTSLDTSVHISNQTNWVYLQSISYDISISESCQNR